MLAEPTRTRILEAARQEFTVYGKAGARMERIAARSLANKAMLYYYFSSKDNLYREVLRSFFSEVFRGLEKIVAGPQSLENKVRSVVAFYIDFYAQNAGVVKIMMREMADGGSEILKVLGEAKDTLHSLDPRMVLGFFESEIRKRRLRSLDSRHLALSLVAMCVFMFIARPILPVMLGIDADDPETLRQRKHQVSELLLRGIRK